MIKKVIYFRIWSTVMTLIAGRVWFGDWHTSWFSLFLVFYCSILHYTFEKAWMVEQALEPLPSAKKG